MSSNPTSLWPLLFILKYYYIPMPTTFSLFEKKVFNPWLFMHTLLVTTCSFVMLWVFCTSFLLSIVLLHFEKNKRHSLLNSFGLRFVLWWWEERNEVHQYRILNKSWILGTKESSIGLQNLWNNDLYVWWIFFQHRITAFERQSMVNMPNKLELHNLTLEAIWLSIGICVFK